MSSTDEQAELARRRLYAELRRQPAGISVVDAAEERRLYEANRAGVDEPIRVRDSHAAVRDWGSP